MSGEQPSLVRRRLALGLYRDCAACVGLCCVALATRVTHGFPADTPAGTPCPNLLPDNGCDIHATLAERGHHGCTTYDCFGAGQRVTADSGAGRDWRAAPRAGSLEMFQSLPARSELHEWLWYLTEAVERAPSGPLHTRALGLLADAEALAAGNSGALSWGEVHRFGLDVRPLLAKVSEAIRSAAVAHLPAAFSAERVEVDRPETDLRGHDLRGHDLRGSDLRGSDLRGSDLRGTDLRGVVLRGADLSGADLGEADLTGADFRGAHLLGVDLCLTRLRGADLSAADLGQASLLWTDLRGADLSGTLVWDALFVTRSQLDSARGAPLTTEPRTVGVTASS